MVVRSPAIFDTEKKGGNDEENVAGKEEPEEKPEEEKENSNSSEQEEKWRTRNHTMIRGVCYVKNVGAEDLKESYMEEFKRFLDRG